MHTTIFLGINKIEVLYKYASMIKILCREYYMTMYNKKYDLITLQYHQNEHNDLKKQLSTRIPYQTSVFSFALLTLQNMGFYGICSFTCVWNPEP